MVTYMVFPYTAAGVAPTFHCIEQVDNAAAAVEAMKLLADHHHSVRVTVWRENTLVFSGPSAECAAWLVTAAQCLPNCPAFSHPNQSCRADCGGLARLQDLSPLAMGA
jgi:hypothetical protein